MGWCGSLFNFTTISIALFAIYFGFTAYQIYNIIDPQFTQLDGPTLDPLWQEGQRLYAECYLSSRRTWLPQDFDSSSKEVFFVQNFTDLSFDWHDNQRSVQVNVTFQTFARSPFGRNIWQSVRNNGTIFLHVHVAQEGASTNPRHDHFDRLKAVHQVNPLIKFMARRNLKNATKLVHKYFPVQTPELAKAVEDEDEEDDREQYASSDPALTAPVVSYWKPHMAIRLVTDFRKFPLNEIPIFVYNNIRAEKMPDQSLKYLPAMFLDEMGLTSEKLMPLNRSVKALPLQISFEPMSFGRWQMMLVMEQSFQTQTSLGFANEELDQIRSMIADTNPYLLAFTMSVSLLHMLFDWLAFKSDIAFWRANKNPVGISVRSMVTTFISQVVIFLYLMEEKTTLLVLVPSGISAVIQVWKIFKVMRAEQSQEVRQTAQVDQVATKYMNFGLLPLVIGYATYSLLYKEHTGWYSWVLGSLTGAVYGFGFIMMTPQLFINYKLKSVAHLPWNFLIYRALNTFIDDLFAFIITMPTMHRISCFRDDIVFMIYLYQRWIYPVDRKRKFDEDDASSEATEQPSQESNDVDAANQAHPHHE